MSDDKKPEVDEETMERRQRIADHQRFTANAANWQKKNLKASDQYDSDYQSRAFEYNTQMMKSRWNLQDHAEMEACRHAFTHGLVSGGMYGSVLGLGYSIYKRKLMMIPKYGLAVGLTYGFLLGSSAWFRFDV